MFILTTIAIHATIAAITVTRMKVVILKRWRVTIPAAIMKSACLPSLVSPQRMMNIINIIIIHVIAASVR